MNEFSAAMGLCNLRTLKDDIRRRGIVESAYRERLSQRAGLRLLNPVEGVASNHAYLPVTIDSDEFGVTRDGLHEGLAIQGIYTRKYFYPLVTDFDPYREDYDSSGTPNAARLSNEVLTLPMYADLQIADVNRVCDAIIAAGAAV